MSLKSHEARKLAIAGLAAFATLGVATSSAEAGVKTQLKYNCKYPLIGVEPLTLDIDLGIPQQWPVFTDTDEFPIVAKATAGGDTVKGLKSINGLAAISGESTALANVILPTGAVQEAQAIVNIDKYTFPNPIPDPLILDAAGATPSLFFDDPGTATIKLKKLMLNLRGYQADGSPKPLVELTRGIDNELVTPSDNDPNTFDVYCKLVDFATNPEPTLGSFKICAEGEACPPDGGGGGGGNNKPTAPGEPPEGSYTPADFTPNSINLKWTASTDVDGDLKEYLIEWDGDSVRVPAPATSKLITGLGAESDYLFTITAIDAKGNESDSSEQFLLTPGGNLPPTPPTNTAGVASQTSVALSWTAGTDPDGAVAGYNVYKGGVKVNSALITGTTLNVTGLTADTSYDFEVETVDNGTPALSTKAPKVTVKTLKPNTAPTAPTNVTGVPALTSVALSWTAATDPGDGGGVAGYNVYRNGVKVNTALVTATTLNVTGLTQDTAYDFEVEAVDNGVPAPVLTGPKSAKASIRTTKPNANVAPTAPTNVAGAPSPTSVKLTWTAGTDTGTGSGVAGYNVYKAGVKVNSALITTTSYDVTGLAELTPYKFQVETVDNGVPAPVLSTKSAEITVTTTKGDTTGGALVDYTLKGSATLKTLTKGTLPLSGGIQANLDTSTGKFTADLQLADTNGRLTALGFLPVSAKIGFVPAGKTTGTLLEGVLLTKSFIRIKVKEVKLFGAIPLAGGNSCQTKNLSEVNLKSTKPDFAPFKGGNIAGTFKISDLNGCGALNGLVSPLTAGSGNTISLDLTPIVK